MSEPVWLSQSAYDRLQAELDELRTTGRAQASAAIEEARSHGDLRENAEYDSAKEEQGKMEARIRQLQDMLRNAQVGEAPTGETVSAGTVVTITDADGDEDTFLLGSREDRVPNLSVVSVNSPLGRALVGRAPGDTVEYQAPAGTFSVTVVNATPFQEHADRK